MEKPNKLLESKRFAVIINILIILAIGFIGVWIAYFSMALFTKHGEETEVPSVENMSYSRAVELLHAYGFNVDIRDSLYRDDIKPGYVLEQFPKAHSIVKPGRKIFLYINAVHPKEVVIDDGAERTTPALHDWSYRQGRAKLQELGFKKIKTVTVLGNDDRIIKITANGRPVFKMQKVPVNANIVIEVSDGRLNAIRDSLYDSERLKEIYDWDNFDDSEYHVQDNLDAVNNSSSDESDLYEEPEYFLIDE